ncbi:MAG: hypothetical protein ABWY36_00280 [Leifsonia sp.]
MRQNPAEPSAHPTIAIRCLVIGLVAIASVGALAGCARELSSGTPVPLPSAVAPSSGSDGTGGDGEELPGAGAPETGGEPSGTPAQPEETFDAQSALEAFQRDCAQGVQNWRDAQVDFPGTLTVKLDESLNYNAAVDIRSEPLPPDEVIETDGGSAEFESVQIRCTVAARVIAVGDALTVDEESNELAGGWILQEFTPTGVVEWSWTVDAVKPVDQELRLELRPAIVAGASLDELTYSSASQASFTTDVHVEATMLQAVNFWFDSNWGLIVAIVTPIGIAVLALLGWMRKVRTEARALKRD